MENYKFYFNKEYKNFEFKIMICSHIIEKIHKLYEILYLYNCNTINNNT
jgi:hypothetical protein